MKLKKGDIVYVNMPRNKPLLGEVIYINNSAIRVKVIIFYFGLKMLTPVIYCVNDYLLKEGYHRLATDKEIQELRAYQVTKALTK